MKNLNEAMLNMKENRKKALKEDKLVWTSASEDPYADEADFELIKDDFYEFVLPNIKSQCRNDILIMAGTVGRWNGHSAGGKVMDVDDLFGFGDVDEVEIKADDKNQLVWYGHHHDGTHAMGLYTIPDDEISRKKIVKDFGIIDWLKDMYQWDTEEDVMEDALSRLDTVNGLEDCLAPEDYAKAAEYFRPILADQTPTTEKKELKEDNNDEIVWEDFDKYSEESIGKIRNILENLDLEVVNCKEDKDFYSVCIKDKNSGLSFWMDYHYEGKDSETPIDTDEDDLVGEWNQYIFSTTDDNDMIRKAIQTSYMKNTGDMVAFEEFDGVGYDYLQTKLRGGNLTEGSMEIELGREADQAMEDEYDKLAKIHGPLKAHKMVYGEGSDEPYVITNESGTKKIEVNQDDVSDWSGDIALWGNEDGRIMMYWNEEKGYEYIDHIYMEYDTEISPLLKNLTKDTPLLITLSDKDYDTFEGWKEGKTLDNESKEITEAVKPTIPGLENYENIADKFHDYPAFKANFGELVIIKDKYDNQYKVYKPNAVDSNSYIYYSYSWDMINGWMYGAVMANNGIFKDMKGESLQESRVNRVLHAGDKFVNPNGVECLITSVDTEHLLDGEPQVTYKIGKDYKCYKQSSVNAMLDQNQYKEQDYVRKIESMDQNIINTLDQVYSESLNEEVTVKGMKDIIDNAKNDFQINGAIHTLGFKDADLSNKLRTQFKDMQSNGSSFEDIKSALSAELVPALESKELNEDQYENNRRRGIPSTQRIAEQEYYDNEEWYKEHAKDYLDITDFVNKEIAEIASEYNLVDTTAEKVCKEIYRLMIGETKTEKIIKENMSKEDIMACYISDITNYAYTYTHEAAQKEIDATLEDLKNDKDLDNLDKAMVMRFVRPTLLDRDIKFEDPKYQDMDSNLEEDVKNDLGIESGSDEEAKLSELEGRNFKDEFNALSKEEQDKYKELIPMNQAFLSADKARALANQYGVDEGILWWLANIGKHELAEKKFNLDKADDVSYMKSTNQYNYDKRQLRIDKKNKTYELGQFKILGKSDKYTDKEIDNTIAKLKELGYKEVKKENLEEAKGITIGDLYNELCSYELDTEYREAFAEAEMNLGYLSNTPLSLQYGSEKQKKELEQERKTKLSGEKLKEFVRYIDNAMKNDYQYNKFKPFVDKYLK